MATLDQRLQVLIDDERLRRVRAAAKLDGVSVGEWVRGLIVWFGKKTRLPLLYDAGVCQGIHQLIDIIAVEF